MRNFLLLITCTIPFFFACKNVPQRSSQQAEIPEALENNSSSGYGLSKRGEANLVVELYDEIAEKTPELKALEQQLDDLADQKPDSTEAFNKYTGKNSSYYSAANRLLCSMQDSLLREKIKIQVDASLAAYEKRATVHESILQTIDTRVLQLNDLRTVLMIIKTLPVIEAYQQSMLPSASPLSGILEKYNAAIQQADTLIKKR